MAKKGSLSITSENIFPVIKKWLYSDHDIFYRELISNGCDAITKLKEGYKVRKVDWDESHYIYMDEEGYVRRRDGNKSFIKLNNDVWEEFK